MTNAEAWFNIALRPRKPLARYDGQLRTATSVDSHTAPELGYDVAMIGIDIYPGTTSLFPNLHTPLFPVPE